MSTHDELESMMADNRAQMDQLRADCAASEAVMADLRREMAELKDTLVCIVAWLDEHQPGWLESVESQAAVAALCPVCALRSELDHR